MARKSVLSAEDVHAAVLHAGPAGISPESLAALFAGVSRSSLNRRLLDLVMARRIDARGKGKALKYVSTVDYPVEAIRRFFEVDYQERPYAGFHAEWLLPVPDLEHKVAQRLRGIQARARKLDRKFLSDFLIDISWASSLLEGSTYSALDTQALLAYGERNQGKPAEDAVLILNHKNAIEHLWANRELSVDNLCTLQAMLTDGHGLPEVADSDHFLPDEQRGRVREYQEVTIARSAYSPPYRPGEGYTDKALTQIVESAKTLPPVQAAFYLMTRIPYLQAFSNGNKRTARLAANIPLLQAGLLPISFVDFRKDEYLLGMLAFYELGDVQIIGDVFIGGYIKSVVRGSDIAPAQKVAGFDMREMVEMLAGYVRTQRKPEGLAAKFLD